MFSNVTEGARTLSCYLVVLDVCVLVLCYCTGCCSFSPRVRKLSPGGHLRLRGLKKAGKGVSQMRADRSTGPGLWWTWRPRRLIRNSTLRARESAFRCNFITDWLCDIQVVISAPWLPCWQNDEELHKLNPKILSSPWFRHFKKPGPVPNSQRFFK